VDGTFNQVDWQTVRKQSEPVLHQQEDETVRQMLELEDPHRFMDPKNSNYASGHSGELTGIGIKLLKMRKQRS